MINCNVKKKMMFFTALFLVLLITSSRHNAFAMSTKDYNDLIDCYRESLADAVNERLYGKPLKYGFVYVDNDTIPDLVVAYEHGLEYTIWKEGSRSGIECEKSKKIDNIYVVPRKELFVAEYYAKDGTYERWFVDDLNKSKADEINTRNYFGTHLPKDKRGNVYAKIRLYPIKTKLEWAYSKAKTAFRLSAYWKNVYLGIPYKIKLTTTASGKAVWKSSKPSVATVDQNGRVVAKKTGYSDITVTLGGLKEICRVVVKKATIKLSKKRLTLSSGRRQRITAEVYGPTKKTTWKSSDNTVATVTSGGVITARRRGTATITATSNRAKATCKVTVS